MSLLICALAACSSEKASKPAGLSCVADLDLGCAPLYPPDFHHVYTNTLHPSCALPGSSCHSSQGKNGGLAFESEDEAYNLLLGKVDGRARVNPGDPACSLLVERLESTDPRYTMPRGGVLSAEERCAIEQWVAAGAKR